MNLKPMPQNDRLCRWMIVDDSAPGKGKPVIAENIREELMAQLLSAAPTLVTREQVLKSAMRTIHAELLSAMGEQRDPVIPLGLVENALAGIRS